MMNGRGTGDGQLRLRICWILLGLWAPLLLITSVGLKSGLVLALGALVPVFTISILLLHGSIAYGWAGIGVYLAIAIPVGFIFEALSVAYGFPFGSYVHHSPGPKPLGVPIAAFLGYGILGWYAWCMGKSIARAQPWRTGGLACFTAPLIAAFIVAGFDYPYDPIGASVEGMWTYTHPSGQFGVPLTNYLGWIFTGWVIFQLVALCESRFSSAAASTSRSFWLLPCVFWIWTELRYPVLYAMAPGGNVTVGGRVFVIADIYEAALAGSLFSVMFPGLVALVCLFKWNSGAVQGRPEQAPS